MAYHVTLESHLSSILEHGLLPRIGDNSKELGETDERIYAFVSKEALEDALLNWMGEIYEDVDEDLVFLEIADTCFERINDSNGDLFFECHSYEAIPPSEIVRIYDERWEELARPGVETPDSAFEP